MLRSPGRNHVAIALYLNAALIGGLVVAVLYHSLNGLKITLIDLFPRLVRRIRPISIAFTVVFVLALIPTAWIMLGQAWDLLQK